MTDTIGSRRKATREAAGMTPHEAGMLYFLHIGGTPTYSNLNMQGDIVRNITRMEDGEEVGINTTLLILGHVYGVRIDWLRTGEGEMKEES